MSDVGSSFTFILMYCLNKPFSDGILRNCVVFSRRFFGESLRLLDKKEHPTKPCIKYNCLNNAFYRVLHY